MVDIAYYRDIQEKQSKPMAAELGYVVKDLGDGELYRFGLSFERQFIQQFPERELTADLYERHIAEILLGAMISKEQMDAEVDGESPGAGKVGGPLIPRAGWLGIGDDWEDASPFATGSPQNWVHSGTTLMAGTVGNAVRIGENAVHVIIGYASKHPSPKIESIQNTLDGKLKPALVTYWAQQAPYSLRIKELDIAVILKKSSTILTKIFASAAHGASVADHPYPIAVSYIKEEQLRIHDIATIPGTTNDVILTT